MGIITYTNLIFTERNTMPGIKNRGTRIHKVKTKYNRKKKKRSLDDNLLIEEQENYPSSGGVVNFNHSYSLPPLVAKYIGEL